MRDADHVRIAIAVDVVELREAQRTAGQVTVGCHAESRPCLLLDNHHTADVIFVFRRRHFLDQKINQTIAIEVPNRVAAPVNRVLVG